MYVDFLNDILESIEKIELFTEGMDFEQFKNDDKTTYAVIRAFEIIGEAAKEIPTEIKEKYPKVPWKEMGSMRDKLIHAYFGIDLEVVWRTIHEDITELKPLIKEVVKKKQENKITT